MLQPSPVPKRGLPCHLEGLRLGGLYMCCTIPSARRLQIALASAFGSGIFVVDLFGPFRYQLFPPYESYL